MRYVLLIVGLVLAAAAVTFAQEPEPAPAPTPTPEVSPVPTVTATPTFTDPVDQPSVPPDFAAVQWRKSQSKGSWARKGRLVRGVMLPELGEDFFTWDPIKNQIPNREWRRYGTDRLIRTVLTVIHEFRTEHDGAQRIGIMDLSRTHGGHFGREYGGLGHASHQNGLDIDILYPRKDGTEARPVKPSHVDRALAQELVDRFVEAGAIKVFVGPKLNLKGPKNVVIPLIYHDDHLHVRVR
jgi:murein endopeptidase